MEKGFTQKILDHGYVKFIDSMGTDETIVEAARMSTNKGFISWEPYRECSKCGRVEAPLIDLPNFFAGAKDCEHKWVEKPDGDTGFLEFLLENRHTSPFEQVELAIEVQAPIFVYREWHRHRTQSYNELSARYTQMPNLHYVPDASRLKAVASANKQEASVGDGFADPDTALEEIMAEQQRIYDNYEDMLKHGVPKEIARVNTPVSRYSRMRAKTDIWNWLHFLNLRMRPNAMWEIRQFANAVAAIIEEQFPKTYWLFEEYMLHAQSFSRTEMKVLRKFFATRMQLDGLTDLMAGEVESRPNAVKRVRTLLEKLK